MITLGGDAELELVDSLDPFSEVCLKLMKQIFMTWLVLDSLLLHVHFSFSSGALHLAMHDLLDPFSQVGLMKHMPIR